MWHIGQRVVCVDDRGFKGEDIIYPLKGCIYTIREVDPSHGQVGLRFDEIVNTHKDYIQGYSEKRFKDTRFRPIDEKRINIFRAMLKNKEKEKVE